MHLLIANWKLNKTAEDARNWVKIFASEFEFAKKSKIIIAPSFPLIEVVADELEKYPNMVNVLLAAQDVSEDSEGAHTGEVGAFQLADMVDYVIIGHSEVRSEGVSLETINLKIINALESGINPIVCFSELSQLEAIKTESKINIENCLFAYEPLASIGTGNNAPIDEVTKVFKDSGLPSMIYGGSVNSTNIGDYRNLDFISGFLVGTASLDPYEFIKLSS